MTDDYHANLDQARRIHKGTVFGALLREWREARPELDAGRIARGWWAYQGRQARPFVAYTRFHPNRLTVAVIAGRGQGTKRMPVICDALDRLALEKRLTLRFESVTHEGLKGYLYRRGYRNSDGNPASYPDLDFDPARP